MSTCLFLNYKWVHESLPCGLTYLPFLLGNHLLLLGRPGRMQFPAEPALLVALGALGPGSPVSPSEGEQPRDCPGKSESTRPARPCLPRASPPWSPGRSPPRKLKSWSRQARITNTPVADNNDLHLLLCFVHISHLNNQALFMPSTGKSIFTMTPNMNHPHLPSWSGMVWQKGSTLQVGQSLGWDRVRGTQSLFWTKEQPCLPLTTLLISLAAVSIAHK